MCFFGCMTTLPKINGTVHLDGMILDTPEQILEYIKVQKHRGWPDLDPKHREFANEYLINGFKHREAAKEVGVSDPTRAMRNPLVRAYIANLQELNGNIRLLNQQFVEQRYMELIPKLMGEEEVPIFDVKEGISVNAKKFHSAETVAVLRDLGKASGYQADEEKASQVVNVQINIGDLTGE